MLEKEPTSSEYASVEISVIEGVGLEGGATDYRLKLILFAVSGPMVRVIEY